LTGNILPVKDLKGEPAWSGRKMEAALVAPQGSFLL
jgi:hypothetical protein